MATCACTRRPAMGLPHLSRPHAVASVVVCIAREMGSALP